MCAGKYFQTVWIDNLGFKIFRPTGGEEGKDACFGDGGSPLVCPGAIRGYYVQAGIVSSGIECGKKDVPGFYVETSYYKKWIDSKLLNERISLNDVEEEN